MDAVVIGAEYSHAWPFFADSAGASGAGLSVYRHRRKPRNHYAEEPLRVALVAATETNQEEMMSSKENDPLAQFGLDAIDLRWTLKDIASKRAWIINKDHLPRLIDLGLVEMREEVPYLTRAGENAVWER